MQQRQLGQFEQAFTLTNQAFGLAVVSVLRLRQGPLPEVVRHALDAMQACHPLLRVSIAPRRNGFAFVPMQPVAPIPLNVVERAGDNHWRAQAEQALNHPFDPTHGPLMRCVYLTSKGPDATADLICAFHHAIVDASSCMGLFHELLTRCATLQGDKDTEPDRWMPQPMQPATDTLLPPRYKGVELIRHLIPFIVRQVLQDRRYRKQTKHTHRPVLHPQSTCRIHSLTLSQPITQALVRKARRARVSLNSVLAASLLMAVYRHRYPPDARLLRTLVFSNLRPYLKPSLSAEALGCYISMLRYAVSIAPHDTLWTVARTLNEAVYASHKRGEKYLAALMSKRIMQQMFRKQNERMAATALSYAGPLPLDPAYGRIEVTDVHGFITANRLGPEYSAFGHLWFGRLRLDFMYMAADMDEDHADAIAEEIKQVLQG